MIAAVLPVAAASAPIAVSAAEGGLAPRGVGRGCSPVVCPETLKVRFCSCAFLLIIEEESGWLGLEPPPNASVMNRLIM